MSRIILYVIAILVLIHGLIHLMGFVAYWPLAEVAGLPYKTTLLGERWVVGPTGMRLFSMLWLITAVGLVTSSAVLLRGHSWWFPVMWLAIIISLLITALDWTVAFRGTFISFVLLVPLLLVLGLRIQPRALPPISEQMQVFNTISLPATQPAPVARYYQTIIGDDVPQITSAIITARGTLRFTGITFPARMRFIHDAGRGYRHYIEATFFGYPLLKVNETYLDGQARMALPMGVIENEPKVDMAANLGLWGESIWLPSIFITDSRVSWQAIDDSTAELVVPFEDGEDVFTVHFDTETNLIQRMEAMRYREATDIEKIPWQLDVLAWDEYQGILIPSLSTVTWADEGTPWLIIAIDEVDYNSDVNNYIRSEGP